MQASTVGPHVEMLKVDSFQAGIPAPLTEAQEGLWYAQSLDPDNPIYNTGQYVRIEGDLDVEAFSRAVNTAMEEADAIAVTVVESKDGPVQQFDTEQIARLEFVDLRTSDDSNEDLETCESEALKRIHSDMNRPLDLSKDRLAAQVLFQTGDLNYIWYQRIHHIVTDGYGTGLLTERISDLYGAYAHGTQTVTAKFGSASKVNDDDSEYRDSTRREKDRQFWHNKFSDLPEVVGIVQGNHTTSHGYLRSHAELPTETVEVIKSLASELDIPWPDVLTSLIAAYIQRHINSDEAIVGVPAMNRLGRAAALIPAMVMNVLPIRVRANDYDSLSELIRAVARDLKAARRHGRYRSEQLRRDLGMLGENRRLYGPLINILPFQPPPTLANLHTSLHTLSTGPVDDLTITVRPDDPWSGFKIEIDANPGLYSELDIEEHAERLITFVANAVRADNLASVPTLTPEEFKHWTETVNQTDHPVKQGSLFELIDSQMKATPDAQAILYENQSITYGELDRLTNNFASGLFRLGVSQDDIVAVAVPRSVEMMIAILGIMRIGAAYLPIDTDHPIARIEDTLASAKPKLIVTTNAVKDRLPDRKNMVTADDPLFSRDSGQSTTFVKFPATNAAYVIYTSGSTGKPKGVVVEHQAIVNRLEWMRVHYNVDSKDRIIQKTPTTFDVSVWELFLPFISGATLVVAPPEAHKDPVWLAEILREQKVTIAHFVPSMLSVFLSTHEASQTSLTRVFCSGEALPANLRDRFHTIVDAELHNLYGPTEAAVDVTWWNASKGDNSAPVPIGKPVWNTQLFILDRHLRPVPPGVAGDLYLAGVQLARGYLGQKELTDSRFVENPFAPANSKMYDTGDLAYWRRDGAVVFIGRSDHQVKIRGFRIELGDIETALLESGEVREAIVIVRNDNNQGDRLVAYVTAKESVTDPDLEKVRLHLRHSLPEYMIPNTIMLLDEMPLSPNGKLDRSALPAPQREAWNGDGDVAQTPTEEKLATLFSEILEIDSRVHVNDDFFSLGGHSLLAARLMLRVREIWDCDLRLGVVFAHPTVRRLAEQIDLSVKDTRHDEGLDSIIRLSGQTNSELSPIFCIHPAGGISWCYGALAREFGDRRTTYAIQARGLDLDKHLPARLEDVASDYIEQIKAVYPNGPYNLVGWSVGGILAQAMAAQLEAQGEPVGIVAMLDSYPSDRWRNEPEPDEGAALKALLLIAGYDPELIPSIQMSRPEVIDFLRQSGHPLGDLTDNALTGVVRVVENNASLVRNHRHTVYSGDVIHFRAALDHQGTDLSPDEWLPYVDKLIRYDIQALHAHMTNTDSSRVIADLLSHHLDRESYSTK